jgi:hypothetical protein
MRFSRMITVVTFASLVAACGGSSDDGAAPPGSEVNLDAENFDNTITSDEAVLNEAESNQLNVATD